MIHRLIALALYLLCPGLLTTAQEANRAQYSRELGARPGAPTLFAPGTISTGDMELNATFTPDGKTIYFTKRTPRYQFWTVVVSHSNRGRWSTPEVADFSGQYGDFDPFISPDGSKLFFSSNRPVDGRPKQDFDLWVVDRTKTGWSSPTHLGLPVNTASQEFYPTATSDGTLYFCSTRDGGKGSGDIYRSRLVNGQYTEPENLGEAINSKYFDGDPYIAADESFLIFVSYNRPDGLGDGDLYISYRRDGAWTPAQNLGDKINSSALDFCPIIHERYFFFTSERGFADVPLKARQTYPQLLRKIRSPGNGLGDLYRVDLTVLNLRQRNAANDSRGGSR